MNARFAGTAFRTLRVIALAIAAASLTACTTTVANTLAEGLAHSMTVAVEAAVDNHESGDYNDHHDDDHYEDEVAGGCSKSTKPTLPHPDPKPGFVWVDGEVRCVDGSWKTTHGHWQRKKADRGHGNVVDHRTPRHQERSRCRRPTLYRHSSFRDPYEVHRDVADLKKVDFGDETSAICVPSGWKLSIYEHKDFGGSSRTWVGPREADIASTPMRLKDGEWKTWNDQVSSVRIQRSEVRDRRSHGRDRRNRVRDRRTSR